MASSKETTTRTCGGAWCKEEYAMRVVKKPEERKPEMVAAAAKLLAQQGFVRTSVSEIVSAVDVAKGLFYYYFLSLIHI